MHLSVSLISGDSGRPATRTTMSLRTGRSPDSSAAAAAQFELPDRIGNRITTGGVDGHPVAPARQRSGFGAPRGSYALDAVDQPRQAEADRI